MTLDPEVVPERLGLLDEAAAELERQAGVSAEALARDLARRWILERGRISPALAGEDAGAPGFARQS